jgi:hypothetical protein
LLFFPILHSELCIRYFFTHGVHNICGAAWNAVVLFLTLGMGISSVPPRGHFGSRRYTDIEKH